MRKSIWIMVSLIVFFILALFLMKMHQFQEKETLLKISTEDPMTEEKVTAEEVDAEGYLADVYENYQKSKDNIKEMLEASVAANFPDLDSDEISDPEVRNFYLSCVSEYTHYSDTINFYLASQKDKYDKADNDREKKAIMKEVAGKYENLLINTITDEEIKDFYIQCLTSLW